MDEKLMQFEANFSVLDRYGEDVTKTEFITNPAIGRDKQIQELILILLTPEKSAILIGKPGIGKTAIVEGLAYRMQKGDVPDALKGYTIINIKTASLLGTMPSGESKVQKMIDELKTRDKVILFVDEVHMLIGATDSSSLDFANIFKEGLGRGSIKVIGATTTEEYERYILRDKAFTRRFQKVEVPEPSTEETIQIMMGTFPKFEKQTGRKLKYTPFIKERIMAFIVDITSEYKRVYALGSRYPDVSLTLLKQAFSYTVYDNREYVDIFDIRKAIENTKNVYPDVIKKELPRFDKEFRDIMLEEKGEKKVDEWRRETGPNRYETEQNRLNSNIFIAPSTENSKGENMDSENLKKLESIPDIVDRKSLRDSAPVKSIVGSKNKNMFAKIGSTSVSTGFNERFNKNKEAKSLDELLLNSEIEVIRDKPQEQPSVLEKYLVNESYNQPNNSSLILGKSESAPIKEENVRKYKMDSYADRTLDFKKEGINERNDNRDKEKPKTRDYFFAASDFSKNDQQKYSNASNRDSQRNKEEDSSYMNDQNYKQDEDKSEKFTSNKDFLFGAPMYSEKTQETKEEPKYDIFGQLLTGEKIMSSNGILEDKFDPFNKLIDPPKVTDDFLISDVRNADDSQNSDSSRNTSQPKFLEKDIIGNSDSSFNPEKNESLTNDSTTTSNKKWKFLPTDDEQPQNTEFNELKVESKNQDNYISPIRPNVPNSNSNQFINFSDLNRGKVNQQNINNYIDLSNNDNLSISDNVNDKREKIFQSTPIDLKLTDESQNDDNYFDDFYEN